MDAKRNNNNVTMCYLVLFKTVKLFFLSPFVVEYDGLFLSNGPGDPALCDASIRNIQSLLDESCNVPIFGICMGHQLLSLAAGCTSYKMKYVSLLIKYKLF